MMVGLAGQDYMKVGIINNFKEFKKLFDEDRFLDYNLLDYDDMQNIFDKICLYLDSFTTQDLYDCYTTQDSMVRLHNNKIIK